MDEEKRLSLPFVIEKSPYARDSNPWFYEAIFMSDEVDPTFRLRESVTVEGMGIPLAGLAPRGGSRPHANVLKDNGNVHTLTAILDFDRMVDVPSAGITGMCCHPQLFCGCWRSEL